jgi:type IV pilus assembly protein PilM
MASPRSAWGIDIGNRALKAVKLVRTGDGIKVEDFDFIEHETVLSQSGDNRDDLIKQALATFVGRKNTKGSAVSIGVTGQQSFARFIKLPPVEDKQLPSIVRFEALQQIPFPLDEVEWSYQLFSPPDSPDKEVGIFAMRKELVNAHVKQFTDLDLNVQVVQMNPLALYNAVQHDNRLDNGAAMIVDVGAENTDLIIASQHSIWLRSIPIGGNNFTEVIAKAFKLSQEKAEDMKRNISTSKYQKQIFQAMRPVFADLVAEIQRSIGFYGSVNRENKIGKIIALGGTFQLSSLAKYLNQNLQLEVERPNAPVAALPDDSKTAAEFTENILSLYSAYGLALQGIGEAQVVSSLLPAAIRRDKMWKEKNPLFGLAASLFGVGLLVGAGRLTYDNAMLKAGEPAVNEARSVQSTVDGEVKAWQAIQGNGGADHQKFKNVAGMYEGNTLWADLTNDFFSAIPKPQPQVVEGITKADKALLERVPRAQRRVFKVDLFRPKYYPDLNLKVAGQGLLSFRDELLSGASTPGVPAPGGFGAPPGPLGGEFGPGAMPGGEFAGAPTPAPAPAGDPNAAAATSASRGCLVYVRIITPFNPNLNEQADFIDGELRKAMLAIAPDAKRPNLKYRISAVEARPGALRDYAPLMERLRADYSAYQSAKKGDEAPNFGGPPSGGGGEFGPGFNGGAPGGGEFGPAAGGGFAPPGAFGPGGGGFTPGGFAPPGGDPNLLGGSGDDIAAEPFLDPITREDVREDHVIEMVLRVDFDPPAYTPPAPAAAPDGSAPPATP